MLALSKLGNSSQYCKYSYHRCAGRKSLTPSRWQTILHSRTCSQRTYPYTGLCISGITVVSNHHSPIKLFGCRKISFAMSGWIADFISPSFIALHDCVSIPTTSNLFILDLHTLAPASIWHVPNKMKHRVVLMLCKPTWHSMLLNCLYRRQTM